MPQNIPLKEIGLFGILLVTGFLFGYIVSPSDASVREQFSALQSDFYELRNENTALLVANARLQSDIEGGRTLHEEVSAMERRREELELWQRELAEREINLSERAVGLQRSEQEFYQTSNMTQQEIGRASQVLQDYDRLMVERERAQRWFLGLLIFVSIGVVVALFGLWRLLREYSSRKHEYSVTAQEMKYRRNMVSSVMSDNGNALGSEDKGKIIGRLTSDSTD